MKKDEKYNRLPKSFFEKERPIAENEFDDDYVPIDWVSWVKKEEALGNDVDPEFKKFLGMENINELSIAEEEVEYVKKD